MGSSRTKRSCSCNCSCRSGGFAKKLVVVGVLVAIGVDCFAKNLEVSNCTKETDKIFGFLHLTGVNHNVFQKV